MQPSTQTLSVLHVFITEAVSTNVYQVINTSVAFRNAKLCSDVHTHTMHIYTTFDPCESEPKCTQCLEKTFPFTIIAPRKNHGRHFPSWSKLKGRREKGGLERYKKGTGKRKRHVSETKRQGECEQTVRQWIKWKRRQRPAD